MTSDGSISGWIEALKRGDRSAAQPLWDSYFVRLVSLARARLRDLPRRTADEEDLALSAFDSFYRAAERGRFPRLEDRDDLWQLLVVITLRKVCDLAKRETSQSRDTRRVLSLAALSDLGADDLVAAEPTPEIAAQVAEECRRLLGRLGNDTLRSVALWKMEGETHEEIATKLGCVRQTVDRKLRTIRQIWSEESSL
jgi:DNA-directed RNA polymerase specialized sigma24 family protein